MFRPTITEDVMQMAPNVRAEDEGEVRSVTGLSAFQALTIGLFHSSDCVTGVGAEGELVCIAGVVPTGTAGSVWMISTPDISRYKREVVVEGRQWIAEMTEKHGTLQNVVDATNRIHRVLIKHMGFEFSDPIENYGVGKITVVPFKRKQKHV